MLLTSSLLSVENFNYIGKFFDFCIKSGFLPSITLGKLVFKTKNNNVIALYLFKKKDINQDYKYVDGKVDNHLKNLNDDPKKSLG